MAVILSRPQCVNLTLTNRLRWNFNRNSAIFIQENPFENDVWGMAAILSAPQCDTRRSHWMSITWGYCQLWELCLIKYVHHGSQDARFNSMGPGPRFNIKMSSYQCRKSYCGNKMVVRSSYLHNGISYTGKMSSLYWIGALVVQKYVSWIIMIEVMA